ncbi:hypothetical protein KBD49_13715 [Myxococcota bacterium]|nr:hypothetical protein [Myxococcota bacterium]
MNRTDRGQTEELARSMAEDDWNLRQRSGTLDWELSIPVRDRLAMAQVRLCQIRPFLEPVVRLLQVVEEPRVGTLAVDAQGRLYYAPHFCLRWTIGELASLVAHEVLHLVLQHPERGLSLRQRHPEMPHFLVNLAADLEVNEALLRDDLLPWTFFAFGDLLPTHWKLPEGLLMEEYARLLLERQEQERDETPEDPPQEPEEPGGRLPPPPGPRVEDPDGPPTGRSGPGASFPVPATPVAPGDGNGDGDGGPPGDAGPVEWNMPVGPPCSAQGLPRAPWERSPADPVIPAVPERILETARTAALHGMGSQPGTVAERLLARGKGKVPWKRVLGRYLRGPATAPPRPGSVPVDYAYVQPHPASPEPFLLPSLCGKRRRVGIVVDVSGSMEHLTRKALAEVLSLAREAQMEVTVATCDTRVIWKGPWRPDVPLPWSFGGTDLRPAIEALASENLSVVVVVTDCETPWPDRPPRVPVVVCALGRHAEPSPPWALRVEVPYEPPHRGGLP